MHPHFFAFREKIEETEKETIESDGETETEELNFHSQLKQVTLEALTIMTSTNQKSECKSLKKEMDLFEEKGVRTPSLEKLYQALLSVCPSSVSAERMFSASGFLLHKRRCSMKHSTLDNLVFLKCHWDKDI